MRQQAIGIATFNPSNVVRTTAGNGQTIPKSVDGPRYTGIVDSDNDRPIYIRTIDDAVTEALNSAE